jgi:hypothetical protein
MAELDSSRGGTNDMDFSHHRRTAVILLGDGTASAYLAGAMSALDAAGVRVDVVLGKGAGALIAALSAIDADKRLEGDDGLLARVAKRAPWGLRPLYKVTLCCLALSFAAFLSPALVGVVALLFVPFVTVARLLTGSGSSAAEPSWFGYLLQAGEPYYLRAMVVPLIVLCTFWLGWFVVAAVRERRWPKLPELYELSTLIELLESTFWRAVRGTSTDERPRDREELGDAYRKLLAGSLGQRGFRELIFYALDTDGGHEVPFAMLKERFFKRLEKHRLGRAEGIRSEPIDLAHAGGTLLFDALIAALSPPGLVASVALKLPLGTRNGGEVHRFSSSLFAASSAMADAIASGAEQIIIVASCTPGERPMGNALERLTESALRNRLSDELSEAARAPEFPVFLIRPDKQRLSLYEIAGRAQFGNDRLDLAALSAHGHRDAFRLFIDPVLGDVHPGGDESTMPIKDVSGLASGPREL